MNILYVVSRPLEINTSASIRNRATIQGLIQLGHTVDLVTTEPDKKHSNYDDSIIVKNLNTTYLKVGGVQSIARIGRKFQFIKPLKRIIYNIMSKFEIYDNLKGVVNQIQKINVSDKKYDIIISSSDPKSSHLFVSRMYEKELIKEIPWIQIWGDPFLSDITRKTGVLDSRIKREENRLFKYATKIIYVSSLTLKEQQKAYRCYADKMKYEPVPYVKEETYLDIDLKKESLTFLYCGDYSTNIRNIKPLYDAIKEGNHKLIICGHSDLKLKSTEGIAVYPRVSYKKVKEFEKECDVLVHLSNLRGTQIPGKIYQYSGTNKPILFILDGDKELLKKTFHKYKRYIFCENKSSSIEDACEIIRNGDHDQLNSVVKDFSPIKIASNIITR